MGRSLSEQVLAEWRGYYEPRPKRERCRPVGDVVGDVVKNLGLSERVKEAEILKAWRQIVGDFIAAHSEPAALRDGVLYVRVLQPTVHYELDRVWKPRILKMLKTRFGPRVIRQIRFRLS